MRRLVLAAALVVLAAGCSDDADPSSAPRERSSPSASTDGPAPSLSAVGSGLVVATIGSEVVEIDPRTGDKRRLVEVTDGHPTLVALGGDGATVYFVREHGGFAACDRMEVVAVPRAGGEERVLVDVKGYVGSLAVSSDGEQLAYYNSPGCDAGGQVVVRSVDGDDERSIDTSQGPGTVTALAFSPDGERLALGGVESTVVLDPATADRGTDGVTTKAPAGQSWVAPQFLADGRLLVAQRAASVDATPFTALVEVDPETGSASGSPRPLPADVDDLDADAAGTGVLLLDFPPNPQGDYPGARLTRLGADGRAAPVAEGVFDAAW